MTDLTIKEYFARDGSPYSAGDAQKIGPVLAELAEQGGVTTRDVVDAARSKNSPLHKYFEWNDKVAADKFRLRQANDMLSAIRVRFVEDGEQRESRAFQITRRSAWEGERRSFRSFSVLHDDSAFAAQMMQNAFEDLGSWRARYEPYVSLWKKFGDVFQGVTNQISEFAEEYKAKALPSETNDALADLIEWRDRYQQATDTWEEAREQIEFIMEAIADAEKVFAKATVRHTCIRCGNDFKGLSSANRICPRCMSTKRMQHADNKSDVVYTA